jgi:DNA-binding SARP family transcriptional activator/Tfp pilus assembly protein PilF
VELRILGPIDILGSGRPLVPYRRLARVLLGTLALRPNTAARTEWLIDALWEGNPPASAAANVRAFITQLRRLFDADGPRIDSAVGGYTLVVTPDQLDALRFEAYLDQGKRLLETGHADAAAEQLARARGLWRGPLLDGVPIPEAVLGEAHRLEDRLLEAIEDDVEARLALGRHAELAAELTGLTASHGLRERLWRQRILALYLSGRQAESLKVYHHLSNLLQEELGTTPGPESRLLYERILRGDPVGAGRRAPIPRQLPFEATVFVGRRSELTLLDQLDRDGGICVVTGSAGVGKTALVMHWAHRALDRFPDGQLHVDLHGYAASEPMRPIDALARFLHALGTPAEQVPVDTDEAAALYRSLLADRRMLVLLDNAATAEQIRPLLPGPGCPVLVTSRDRLAGLTARDGAQRLTVDVLTEAEAEALLHRLLGPALADAEPEALRELAAECARLPLALRIAAANLTGDPYRSVSTYLADLRSVGPLAGLAADSDDAAAVGAAIGYSYRRLPGPARLVFRRMGLVPGPELTAEAAAALVDTGVDVVRPLLQQLAEAHLLAPVAVGRYTFHDLLRRYAREHALTDDGEAACAVALDRLFDLYLSRVDAAARCLYATKIRLPLSVTAQSTPPSDAAGMLAWLETERPNLVAAVRYAAEHGPRSAAWRLADALRGFFWMRMYLVDWLTVARCGLAAADRQGDAAAQAAGYLNLASVQLRQGRYRQAIADYQRCVALAEQAGWLAGMAGALANIGSAYRQLGELGEAVAYQRRALDIRRRVGDLTGQASALDSLANAYQDLGELQSSVDHHEQALAIHRAVGNRPAEALALTNLADSQLAMGHPKPALHLLLQALDIHREVGDRGGESENLRIQAEVYREQGRYDQALQAVDAALAIARDSGDRRFEADALNTAGAVHCQLAQVAIAVDQHTRALRLARSTESRRPEALALIGLASAYHKLGRHGNAARHAQAALTLAERCGLREVADRARDVLRTAARAPGL